LGHVANFKVGAVDLGLRAVVADHACCAAWKIDPVKGVIGVER
jgi:hypothetical protein